MSSAVDIQIVSTPNLAKIENFLNDSTYRETIEFSANFNTRLCIERRLRLPFFDPQTGVAQNHCSLFMDRRQRMPGFREGQIYSYPAARWRKSRRQYLTKTFRPFGALQSNASGTGSMAATSILGGTHLLHHHHHHHPAGIKRTDGSSAGNISGIGSFGSGLTGDMDVDFNGSSSGGMAFLEESSSLGGADTSDSKDSQNIKDDLPKEWFYDDIDINEMDALDEPKSPADDEYDYDPRYGNKKRKKRKPGRKPASQHLGDGPRKGRPPGGGGSGRGGSGSGGSSGGASGSGAGGDGTGSGSNTGGGGSGRGRGRRKNSSRILLEPPSPTSIAEPPSFESAAAAVEHSSNDSGSNDLRSYRKYL